MKRAVLTVALTCAGCVDAPSPGKTHPEPAAVTRLSGDGAVFYTPRDCGKAQAYVPPEAGRKFTYALANDIAHIFRDDSAPKTFSAAAWEVFDDWCAHVEEALGEDIRERVPPEVMADIFYATSTVEDGIAKVREWDAARTGE